jgi:hypothetical protein
MIIARALAISVASGAIAAITAAPAAADFAPGTYSMVVDSATGPGTWTVTPCGDGCVNVTYPGGTNSLGPHPPYSSQAHLADGQWTMTLEDDPEASTCPSDGHWLHGVSHYVWSDATLTGTETGTITPAACGWADGTPVTPDHFTLTRVG